MLTLSKPTASISNIKGLISSSLVAIAASTISIGALTDSANAISFIGNTTGATNTTGLTANVIDTNSFLAIQFTTPSTPIAGYLLNFVSLKVLNYRTNGLAASGNLDRVIVSITDNSNVSIPGSDVFADFKTDAASVPSSANTLRTITLSANSNFIFAPNTTYWLQIAAFDATTTFDWTSNDLSATSPSNESISPTGLATLGASGYQYTINGGTTFTPASAFNTFNIDVTPVPFEFEASGGIAILGGLFVANKLRKRIQKNKIDN